MPSPPLVAGLRELHSFVKFSCERLIDSFYRIMLPFLKLVVPSTFPTRYEFSSGPVCPLLLTRWVCYCWCNFWLKRAATAALVVCWPDEGKQSPFKLLLFELAIAR